MIPITVFSRDARGAAPGGAVPSPSRHGVVEDL